MSESEQEAFADAAIAQMKDTGQMSIRKHHALCLGVMAECYPHAPPHLQLAIMQGLEMARDMGMPIEPGKLAAQYPPTS